MASPLSISDFAVGRELGRGSFSVVFEAQWLSNRNGFLDADGDPVLALDNSSLGVALKRCPTHALGAQDARNLRAEIDLLSRISVQRHPHILNLLTWFEERDAVWLVLELKPGGDLFERLAQRGSGFSEKYVQKLTWQMGTAVAFLHANGIVHRDLKPENMLFSDAGEDADLCLADFGFAKVIESNGSQEAALHTPCGTVGYVAPEIACMQSYSKAVDMWALGVTMYTLLCGFPPFYAEDDAGLLDLIADGRFSFPSPWWDAVSDEAKHLVRHLIEKDPLHRISADQLLLHPWLESERTAAVPADIRLPSPRPADGLMQSLQKLVVTELNEIHGNSNSAGSESPLQALAEWEMLAHQEPMYIGLPSVLSPGVQLRAEEDPRSCGMGNSGESQQKREDHASLLNSSSSPNLGSFLPSPLVAHAQQSHSAGAVKFTLTPLADSDDSFVSPTSPETSLSERSRFAAALSRSIETLRDSFSMQDDPQPAVVLIDAQSSKLWQRRKGREDGNNEFNETEW